MSLLSLLRIHKAQQQATLGVPGTAIQDTATLTVFYIARISAGFRFAQCHY
jgi:hypothetical protein